MREEDDRDRAAVQRILDANANRAAEGIRVVEEIARFSLRDAELTARLKDIRHAIRSAVRSLASDAIDHRDSPADVGRESATASELARGSIAQVARANFARAEEALRVLEEFGKIVDERGARECKRLRFELYEIERRFFEESAKPVSLPPRPFLYPILDRSAVDAPRVPEVSRELVAGGADIVQYRAKGIPRDEMRRDLVAMLAAARPAGVPVVVNDDVELAVEVGADGAHVGAADMPPEEARAMLGPGRILGVTVLALDELGRIPPGAASYVAVGPVFPSPTKPEAGALGLDVVRGARRAVSTPLVAIGGITPENAAAVVEAGADGIAVVSAILSGDVRKNCFTFRKSIGTKRECG